MKYLYVIILAILIWCPYGGYSQDYGWNFRWPRKKALEVGNGISRDGILLYGGYTYFFPARKHTYKNFTNLIPGDMYTSFPCKRKTLLRIPPGLAVKISGFYEKGSGKEIQYRIIGIDGAFLYTFYYNRKLYTYLKGGVTVSHDALITPLKEGNTFNRYDQFNVGLLGGVELEWLIGHQRNSSVITGYDQRFLFNPNEQWGKKRWYIYAGFRFKIPRK